MAVMVELVISLLDQRITPTWWDRERRMEAIDNASLRQVSAIIDAESRVTCRSSMRRDRGHGTFEKTFGRMIEARKNQLWTCRAFTESMLIPCRLFG